MDSYDADEIIAMGGKDMRSCEGALDLLMMVNCMLICEQES